MIDIDFLSVTVHITANLYKIATKNRQKHDKKQNKTTTKTKQKFCFKKSEHIILHKLLSFLLFGGISAKGPSPLVIFNGKMDINDFICIFKDSVSEFIK